MFKIKCRIGRFYPIQCVAEREKEKGKGGGRKEKRRHQEKERDHLRNEANGYNERGNFYDKGKSRVISRAEGWNFNFIVAIIRA